MTNIFAQSEEEPFEVWEDTGFTAPTVTTDGQRVYAIFVTGIVACFDFDGNKVWEKDLGIPDSMYGYASSLEIPFVVIIGEKELKKKSVKLKNMKTGKEKLVKMTNLEKYL